MIGQHLQQTFVVLFRRIKVSVDEWPAIRVAPAIDGFRIFSNPPFEAPFLLRTGHAPLTAFRVNRGFEMIGERDHEMYWSTRYRAQGAHGSARKDLRTVRDFLLQTHDDLIVRFSR